MKDANKIAATVRSMSLSGKAMTAALPPSSAETLTRFRLAMDATALPVSVPPVNVKTRSVADRLSMIGSRPV